MTQELTTDDYWAALIVDSIVESNDPDYRQSAIERVKNILSDRDAAQIKSARQKGLI